MKIEILKIEYKKLLLNKSLKQYREDLDLFANFWVDIGFNNRHFSKEKDIYAGTILQMFICKNISLQRMLSGIDYESSEGIIISNILEPTTIISHARTIYELLCTFELVYVLPDTDEKKLILFNLWCLAGLNNRADMYSELKEEDIPENLSAKYMQIQLINKQQYIEDKEEIDFLKKEIENTNIYSLDNNKKIIDNQIKNKKCQIVINSNNTVKPYGLKEIPSLFGMNNTGLFNKVYNYFSMYAHSSYISVLQFEQIFKNRNDIDIIITVLKNVLDIYSVFVTDYLKLFPHTKSYFFKQNIETQMKLRAYAEFLTRNTSDLDKNWIKVLE